MIDLLDFFSTLFSNTLYYIYVFFTETWWFLLFLILLPVFHSVWLYWRQSLYKRAQKYVLLELKIPREISKSPLGMEQVLSTMWGLRNRAEDIAERYWKGEVTRWFSLEIVSFGGETHFYIRAFRKQKKLVKAAFLSYYSDLEITEVNDYVDALPKDVDELNTKGLNLWGSEMILSRPAAYPIKTYAEFEDKEEEKSFDPISSFLEVLGEIKKHEVVGIQINIAPIDPGWRKRWSKLIEELQKPKQVKTGKIKDGVPEMKALPSTPGEKDTIKAIEENLSNLAFDTIIRFIYVSPRAIFYDSFARRGITGAFSQYATLNLNSFRQNYKMSTRTRLWLPPHFFPKWRNDLRIHRILHFYRTREMPEETFMGRVLSSHPLNWNFHSKVIQLGIKSIATLFHPPTRVVLTTPHIRRIESRKAAPEAGLSIFGEESALEKFGH